MNAEDLTTLFDAAQRAEKYVWLKHRLDRHPKLGSFSLSDDGYLCVALYLSFIDDYEGMMKIRPDCVEWAHVSTQTLTSVMRDRLAHAETNETLVRLSFSDSIEPQLMKHQFYATQGGGTVMFGNFVHEQSLLSDPVRSRIPLNVLLDIANTDIPSSSINKSDRFSEICDEPNLCHFAEKP